jgi:hypothetical protein
MEKYYIHNGKEQLGPFSFDDLKQKGINSKTMVWFEGFSTWKEAQYVPELNEIISNNPPPFKKEDKQFTYSFERIKKNLLKFKTFKIKDPIIKFVIFSLFIRFIYLLILRFIIVPNLFGHVITIHPISSDVLLLPGQEEANTYLAQLTAFTIGGLIILFIIWIVSLFNRKKYNWTKMIKYSWIIYSVFFIINIPKDLSISNWESQGFVFEKRVENDYFFLKYRNDWQLKESPGSGSNQSSVFGIMLAKSYSKDQSATMNILVADNKELPLDLGVLKANTISYYENLGFKVDLGDFKPSDFTNHSALRSSGSLYNYQTGIGYYLNIIVIPSKSATFLIANFYNNNQLLDELENMQNTLVFKK